MQRIFFSLLFCLLFLGLSHPAHAQREVIDKVVAMVGGEVVLLSEIEEQYALAAAQNPTMPPEVRCQILDQLMTTKLMLNQAKLDSIEVTEAQVEDQLNARIDRILTYMNGDVTQFEEYYGQTITQVKDQFREDLQSQLLVERMRAEILKQVQVTPSEVKAFFNQIPRDSLPYFNAEVEIGEIVYKPKVNPEERQKAVSQLEDLRTRIVDGGEKFEELATKFSDDGSARGGGDLGWTRRGKFVPEFEAAAYKLEPNEVSPVVETQFGFHIIQLLERRGNSIRVRHILIRPEITEADIELARQTLDSVRQLISTDTMTFSQAVKKFGDENQQSFNNDGRMINPKTGNTFFEIGDLDPDIYFTIDDMKVGDVSEPLEFADPTGETYLRVIQLQSRTAPHRANLAQDYSKIRQATEQSKQNDFIDRWIQEKVNATYIWLDQRYQSCELLDKWRSEVAARP